MSEKDKQDSELFYVVGPVKANDESGFMSTNTAEHVGPSEKESKVASERIHSLIDRLIFASGEALGSLHRLDGPDGDQALRTFVDARDELRALMRQLHIYPSGDGTTLNLTGLPESARPRVLCLADRIAGEFLGYDRTRSVSPRNFPASWEPGLATDEHGVSFCLDMRAVAWRVSRPTEKPGVYESLKDPNGALLTTSIGSGPNGLRETLTWAGYQHAGRYRLSPIDAKGAPVGDQHGYIELKD